ncbi:MAG: putative PAS/PAC sensor protein [Chloroflexi bacterium]|nr:MAG: putative PAS/PAC sensor protein [Chloroflexota bacterium]
MSEEQLKNSKILIVDDQEANVLVLEQLLKRLGYANYKSLTDARQTVTVFNEYQPDLLLLDLMMPYMDGFAVMEALKPLIPADDYLPILVLTADVTTEAKQRALSGGALDFLTKPFDTTEVALRIKNLLKTHSLHLQLQNQNQILDEKVQQRTAELQRQFQHLASLREIERAIAGSVDLRLTLKTILEQTTEQLKVDAADILLLNLHTMTLEYSAGRGFRTIGIEGSRLRLGEGHAGRAALERTTITIPDLPASGSEFIRAPLLAGEGFVTYHCAPLIAKGQVKGVLEVFHRAPFTSGKEWLDFFETLAGQTAIAIDNAQLFEGLQRSNVELTMAYDATIEGWSHAMDLRDKETEGHTQRVTALTIQLARAMGMSEAEIVHVRRGALLHDMGKLGIPDAILLKPGKLTDEEWVIMRKHPQFAYDMLSSVAYLRPALDIPYGHHEKWDGSGYPRGLKGEEIPLAARLFAVVDVWDALRSDRPYREAWPEDKVIEHIKAGSGSHFDPKVVEIFLKTIEQIGTK